MASKLKGQLADRTEHTQPTEMALFQLNQNSAANSEGLCASPGRFYNNNNIRSETVDATINNDLAPSTAMDI